MWAAPGILQEDDMTRDLSRHNRPVSNNVHPLVYAAVAGLVIWFVLAAWIFFGGAEYMGLLLAMVTGFFLMAMGIPFALWLVWRKHRPGGPHEERSAFVEWASGQFETATGRRNAMGAAIEILLPLAAAATGMTAMGIIFHFVALSSPQL
jgi:hypothetical protein